MEKWVEMRTAYQVAKLGTVSAAAEELGVHRATVNRHIDSLEAHMGTKLFQRHSRGYLLTETGEEFLIVARRAEEMLTDFESSTRFRDRELSGEVIVTTPSPLTWLGIPPIMKFREAHRATNVTILPDDANLRLEYGEAHVALRSGSKPEHPDYVVQPFNDLEFGLYAHEDYIERNGMPGSAEDLKNHEFVADLGYSRSFPFHAWLAERVSQESFVLNTSHPLASHEVILAGGAIGFLPQGFAQRYDALREVLTSQDDWKVSLWLITHVDLHRTDKVQALLRCIRAKP